MQPQTNGYKKATWILAIIVIILVVLLVRANGQTVSDTLGGANKDLSDCRMELSAWGDAHPQGTPRTAKDQSDLEAIMSKCMGTVQDVQGTIGTQGGVNGTSTQ